MIKILYVLLGKKLGEDKAKRILDIIIKKEDDLEMLDVIERIEENERKALEKSKIEGKIENTIEIAKKMIKEGCNIDFVYVITGLEKRKIKELLNNKY